MSKKTFVMGAAVLGAAGLLVKLLGAVFRIPLANMIGPLGMAYYQPAYYIYTFFLIISTSGIPVAISRMISERVAVGNYIEANRVFKISMYIMLAIGIPSFLLLFFGAGLIADLSGAPHSKLAMMAIAPSLILVPVMAAYRGIFQGMQDMNPTAVSQIGEQVFRVVAGLSLAYVLYKGADLMGLLANYTSHEKGAAGAAFGATVGSIGGLLVVLII
ncbi:MAG: oligosaccharide flippase family protein, partial [Anaerovoracaceae bacterium]